METECYPITVLPRLSRLFLDYAESQNALSPFYPCAPQSDAWMTAAPALPQDHRARLADLLTGQNAEFGGGNNAQANIDALRGGAAAVVTGQQVGLFGGPLYTLLKAATAIRLAQRSTASGHPAVPVFWMATEDHDFAEVDHVVLPGRRSLHTLRLAAQHRAQLPAGAVLLGEGIKAVLTQAREILGDAPFLESLRSWYGPQATFAQAFGRMMASVFSPWGLIVMDAASRPFHALGADVLHAAISDAGPLRQALLARGKELEERGYHAQVKVAENSSLLFLIDGETGVRQPLRFSEGKWKAGRRAYDADALLAILAGEPERLSPNALLRPVFEDAILPTAAYVGGPGEIAYFAQAEVVYRCLLGRVTPVLPRLSATLVEPAIATVMIRHGLSLPDAFQPLDALAQKLGARAMPVEGKRKLAAAGNALDRELTALTTWMAALDEGLGRSADTAASKMRYQMNRLRRLAAHHQLERDASLRRHAAAVALALYPDGHPQERTIGGAFFLAQYGEELIPRLVEAAADPCPGHRVLFL